MVLRHFSLTWGPLQGPPYRGGRRGSHHAGSIAESHASKAGLGLRLAPGMAWLAWVAGFGFDLGWLGLGFGLDLASGFNLLGFWLDLI